MVPESGSADAPNDDEPGDDSNDDDTVMVCPYYSFRGQCNLKKLGLSSGLNHF